MALGLRDDELAFYDAIRESEAQPSASRPATIDWNPKDTVRGSTRR